MSIIIVLHTSTDQHATLLQLTIVNAKTIETRADETRVKSLQCYSQTWNPVLYFGKQDLPLPHIWVKITNPNFISEKQGSSNLRGIYRVDRTIFPYFQ